MINRRTIEYEYKMISSFYDNRLKDHRYSNIKRTALGIDVFDDDCVAMYNKMHLFLFIALQKGLKISEKDLLSAYSFAFGVEGNKTLCEIHWIINEPRYSPIEKSLMLIDLSSEILSVEESFVAFVYAGIFLNVHYKDFVVVPVYICDCLSKVTNDPVIRKTFYEGLVSQTVKKHDDSLLEKVIASYNDNRDFFIKNGINEIYLFGSVVDGTYYDGSDLDLVIKTNEDGFASAARLVSDFNTEKFSRKSDIQEYEGFVHHNPKIEKIRLV